MITPKIHLTAYPDRPGRFIFVAVPDERGRYIRTDRSVALVPCPVCGSVVGEPCKSNQRGVGDGYSGTTHARRRSAAFKIFGHGLQADDVIGADRPAYIAKQTPAEDMGDGA